MPSANVQLVRDVLKAWNRGERRTDAFSPAAEFDLSRWLFDVPSVWRISEDAPQRLESLIGIWEEFACRPERVLEVSGQVLAIVSLRMRGRSSGAGVSGRCAAVFALRDGRITSVTVYPDMDEASSALAAAGSVPG